MSAIAVELRHKISENIKRYLEIHQEMLYLLRKYPSKMTSPSKSVNFNINDSFQTLIMTPSPNSKRKCKDIPPRSASSCSSTEIMSPSPDTKKKRNYVPSPDRNDGPQFKCNLNLLITGSKLNRDRDCVDINASDSCSIHRDAVHLQRTPINSVVHRPRTIKGRRSAQKVRRLSAKLSRSFLNELEDGSSSENDHESESQHRKRVRLKRKRSFQQLTPFNDNDSGYGHKDSASQMIPQDLTNALAQCTKYEDGRRPSKRRKISPSVSVDEHSKPISPRVHNLDPIRCKEINGDSTLPSPSKRVRSSLSRRSALTLHKVSHPKKTKVDRTRMRLCPGNHVVAAPFTDDGKQERDLNLGVPPSAKKANALKRTSSRRGSVMSVSRQRLHSRLVKGTKSRKNSKKAPLRRIPIATPSTTQIGSDVSRNESHGSCESIESSSPTVVDDHVLAIRNKMKIVTTTKRKRKKWSKHKNGNNAMMGTESKTKCTEIVPTATSSISGNSRRCRLKLMATESPPRYDMNDPSIYGLLPELDEVDQTKEDENNGDIEDKEEKGSHHDIDQEGNETNVEKEKERKMNDADHGDNVHIVRFENRVNSPFGTFRRSKFNDLLKGNNFKTMYNETESRNPIINKENRYTPLFKASRELTTRDKRFNGKTLTADYQESSRKFSGHYLEQNYISPSTKQALLRLSEKMEEEEKGDVAVAMSSHTEQSLFEDTDFSEKRFQVNSLLRDTESEDGGVFNVQQNHQCNVFEYPSSDD